VVLAQAESGDGQKPARNGIGSIETCVARIEVEEGARIAVTNLRGYLGHLFGDGDTEFHHHDSNPYRYPLIQYKKLGKTLVVLGINEHARTVQEKIPTLTHINLPSSRAKVMAIALESHTTPVSEGYAAYRFATPWLPLNSENYAKYRALDARLRPGFLEGILTGNVLSLLKGVKMRSPFRVMSRLGPHRPTPVICNANRFMGFWGSFALNVTLPNYMGLGKSVAKGFGAIGREEK